MKKLTVSLIIITFLLAGLASAATEFYIFGSFEKLPIVIKDADLYRNDTGNYSFYAKSYHGPFQVNTYLSKADCSLSQVEYPLITNMASSPAFQHGLPIDEAGVNVATLDGSDFKPGSYNLCMESFQSGSSWYDDTSLSLDVINTPPYFNGLISSHYLDDHKSAVHLQNISDVSFDDDGDSLTFSLDTSQTDPAIATCHLGSAPDRTLICDSNNPGTTSVSITISDGYDSATQTIHLIVDNATNTQPYFDALSGSYSYNVTGGLTVDVVDLDAHAFDPDGDPLTFSLDTSQTDPSLATCYLKQSSVLHCDFPGKAGSTALDVTVSDGSLSATEQITLHLFNDSYTDHATAVISGPSQLPVGQQAVFDASASQGSYGSPIVSYDWSIAGQSAQGVAVSTVFNTVGSYMITLDVTDANGETDSASTSVTITDNATVSIVSPNTAYLNEQVTFDGSASTAPAGLSITEYAWTITTPSGSVVDTAYGDIIDRAFSATGTYYITLTITDSSGQQASKTVPIDIKEQSIELSDYDPEEGLRMLSYIMRGHDFERVRAGEQLFTSVDVKNVAGEELDNVRLIVTIPEVGVKFKSSGIDFDDNQRKRIVISEYIPYYLEPGVYYPRITLSDDEIRRVKYGRLEVTE